MLIQRARDTMCVVAFCALVGGQDELVFDGHSLVVDHRGEIVARASQFREELLVATVDPIAPMTYRLRDARRRVASAHARPVPTIATVTVPSSDEPAEQVRTGGPVAQMLEGPAEVYAALVTGLRDYVEKNGFRRAVLGLSGGVDSALVATIAADALRPECVAVAVMPSPYSSQETQGDARQLARNLGVELFEFDIQPVMDSYEATLADVFAGREPELTEENVQARIRGNLLMALSNKFGWLVLATGNKSEMSVGFSTLYGDLAGGFAVIKDCPKTRVYELIRHRNAVELETSGRELVPAGILERPPSAELRPGQVDTDSLPPYPVLDPILDGYVEQDLGREQLIQRGFKPEDVDHVIKLVDRAEYKRRQAPPGIKITSRAFGRDRRVPITNHYRG
jgi:NAD+ synthase (glutamine-hydrolysing)